MTRRWLFALVLVGAALLAFGPTIRGRLTGAAAADLPTQRVGRTRLAETAVAIGTIKPKVGAEVKVGSQVSGVVADLRVNVGDTVERGDLLAALDDRERRARVAALAAELDSAHAEREYAESELRRLEAIAQLLPQLELESAGRNVKVRRAQAERARAALDEARIALDLTVVRAPVAGTIASVSTYVGETVAASFAAPTFVTILDLTRLEVQSYVDEADIGRVHTGQGVTIRVDAFPGRELDGAVRAIYPKAELVNNVVNYVVVIDLADAADLALRPEMTVHVSFVLAQKDDILSVPRAALLQSGGRSFVLVGGPDGWTERPVETGLQTPQRVEIVAGLAEGETIVTDKQAWKDRGKGRDD